MILQIDVTVTGPDGVMTGSTAVTVNQPAADHAAPADPAADLSDLETRRLQQRVQALRWGVSRA